MKTGMIYWKLAVAAFAVLSVSALMAQGPGGGRGFGMGRGGFNFAPDPATLLGQEPVQKELELSDDQKTQVTKLADEARQARRELFTSGGSPEDMQTKMADLTKENKKKVADILLPDQSKRLDEIMIQVSLETGFPMAAATALTQEDLAKKLEITDDQKKKLQDVIDEAGKKMQEMFAGGGGPPDPQEMAKMRTEIKDKAMDVLTAEQKDKLTKLEGKKFDTSTIQMFGRGGRGRGGPGGPGGGAPPGA